MPHLSKILTLLAFLSIVFINACAPAPDLVVNTPAGPIGGLTDAAGDSFLGIANFP